MKANLKFNEEERYAKPVLKWAGGKGQMLPYINKLSDIESIYIPSSTEKRKEFYYKARGDFNANR